MDFFLLGKTPINADSPTGSDVRYDPDFEALQAEIDKLASPSASDGIDWNKVNAQAARILSEKSKDLLVASYLAVSQIHINQLSGMAVGVTVFRDLIKDYWDNLFPPKKRMRGRLGAIQFWVEKTDAVLSAMTPAVDMETLELIQQALIDLDALFNEHLPDPPPLHSIHRRIKDLMEQAAKSAPSGDGASAAAPPVEGAAAEADDKQKSPPKTPPTQRTSSPSSPGASAVDAQPGNPESEQDAQKQANSGFQAIRNAGAFLFENNPKNPDAYRFRRMAAWAKISSLPPANEGKTQIPPPSAQEIKSLEDLKANNNWHVLLQTSEQKLSRFVFWFDLGRFASESLLNLGSGYQSAHQAVCDETAFFLHRIPGIEELAFSDGLPFADPETREWLKQIALGSASGHTGEISLGADALAAPESESMAEVMEQAKSLSRQKQTMEAVGLIKEQLQGCRSEKCGLLWRMALCQILLGSEFKKLAVPHLDQVIADIDNYRVEAWEPAVALQGLALAWSGFRSLSGNRFRQRADELLSRISRLDPAEALRLSR